MSRSRGEMRRSGSDRHLQRRIKRYNKYPFVRQQTPSLSSQMYRRSGFKSAVFSTLAAFGIVLGFVFIVVIGRGANRADVVTSSGASTYGSLNHAKGSCGNTGQAPCPTVDPGWVTVSSESPKGVAAAIASNRDFANVVRQYRCASLDTPTLVHAYDAHTGNSYYDNDHWVVSVHSSSSTRCGIFDFVYDRAHSRLRFSSYGVLTPQDPHSRQAFPYVASSVALARLQSQRQFLQFHMLAGTQPELIFFPIDPNYPYLNSPVHSWTGGGNSALDPIWYIKGTVGHNYFIGVNMTVYTQQNLPIAKGQP